MISGKQRLADAPACEHGCDRQTGSVRIPAGYPLWQECCLALNREFVWPEPVEEDVWKFRLGGYHVLERWLKQRKQRQLFPPDLDYLGKLIHAIRSTCPIMDTIDSMS